MSSPNSISSLISLVQGADYSIAAYADPERYLFSAERSKYLNGVLGNLATASSILVQVPDLVATDDLTSAVHGFSSRLAYILQSYNFLSSYFPFPPSELTAFYDSSDAFYHAYLADITSSCDLLSAFSSDVSKVASLFSSVVHNPATYSASANFSEILHTPYLTVTTCVSSTAVPSQHCRLV